LIRMGEGKEMKKRKVGKLKLKGVGKKKKGGTGCDNNGESPVESEERRSEDALNGRVKAKSDRYCMST